jgi:hypothetical protein
LSNTKKHYAAGDMAELVDSLGSNPRFRDINRDKFRLLLERTEFRVPAEWPGRFDAAGIRELAASAPGTVPFPSRNRARTARWVLAPACAAAAAVLFFLVWPQLSDTNRRTGTITRVSGGTTVSHPDGKGKLDAGDTLAAGDIIHTAPGSSLDISFNESIRMRVLGGSIVTLRRVELERRRVFDAMVSAGSCIMKVNKLAPGESVSLRTPTTEASVKGTAFGVSVTGDGGVRYEVYEGTVRVRRSLPVHSGLGRASADHLSRYFRTHELILEKGKACRINPDAVALRAVRPGPNGPIAGLSLPVVLDGPGALSMRDEAATFTGLAALPVAAETAESGGRFAPGEAPGSGKRITEQEPSVMKGQQFLMYVPETDVVITIGEYSISASRAGVTLWHFDLTDAIASMPVREDGSLYYATARGTVSRLDCTTGTVQWTTLADSTTRAPVRLALDGSGIYFAAAQGVVGRLDRRGDLQWKSAIGEDVSAAPVLTRHMVLIPTRKGVLVGIDKYRGLRSTSVGFPAGIAGISTMQDAAFVASADGRLTAYDMRDAKVLWRYPINDRFAGDVIIDNDSIYLFGRSGKVHRVSMSGDQIWIRDVGNPIVKRPTADAGSFYIPSEETLCIINKISGDVSWSFMPAGIGSGNVAVSRGAVYFRNKKNGLTSLKK